MDSLIRDLPGHLRELGFNHIRIAPEVDVAQDLDAFYTWFVEPSLKHFKAIGAFSEAEADAFLTDLRARAARGHYFSSRTSYGSCIAVELKTFKVCSHRRNN
jgi:hypothetical protein